MQFLVNLNLPKNFAFFNKPEFTFVADINPFMSDRNIWNYALINSKIILTKDSDFYFRSIAATQKPKVVHFEIGNMTLKELHHYFEKNWKAIITLIDEYDLIVVDRVSIRGVL